MANMMDYLLWRGDLSFKQAEFNEVDNLIFSELVYVDFDGIVPSLNEDKSITLKEASKIFFEHHTDEEIEAKVSSTKMAAFLMRAMARTKRFGNIELSNYINDINLKEQSQFCAMTIRLDDGSFFVVYSGTDNTIVGWKENFNMSFLEQTPGQLKAVEYLNEVVNARYKKVRVGGHSKGGNLSVYASVYCKESIQKKIIAIYSNDGPGFSEHMINSEAYHKMLPKIHTIIPESSIVGMLLEHEEEYEVVESSNDGPMQHDAMSWEVQGPSFVHVKSVTEQSVLLDKTLKAWIHQMDGREREEFVDALFGILEEGEIKTVDDLANMKWKQFVDLLKIRHYLGTKSQEALKKTLKLLWKESNQTLKEAVIKKTK